MGTTGEPPSPVEAAIETQPPPGAHAVAAAAPAGPEAEAAAASDKDLSTTAPAATSTVNQERTALDQAKTEAVAEADVVGVGDDTDAADALGVGVLEPQLSFAAALRSQPSFGFQLEPQLKPQLSFAQPSAMGGGATGSHQWHQWHQQPLRAAAVDTGRSEAPAEQQQQQHQVMQTAFAGAADFPMIMGSDQTDEIRGNQSSGIGVGTMQPPPPQAAAGGRTSPKVTPFSRPGTYAMETPFTAAGGDGRSAVGQSANVPAAGVDRDRGGRGGSTSPRVALHPPAAAVQGGKGGTTFSAGLPPSGASPRGKSPTAAVAEGAGTPPASEDDTPWSMPPPPARRSIDLQGGHPGSITGANSLEHMPSTASLEQWLHAGESGDSGSAFLYRSGSSVSFGGAANAAAIAAAAAAAAAGGGVKRGSITGPVGGACVEDGVASGSGVRIPGAAAEDAGAGDLATIPAAAAGGGGGGLATAASGTLEKSYSLNKWIRWVSNGMFWGHQQPGFYG